METPVPVQGSPRRDSSTTSPSPEALAVIGPQLNLLLDSHYEASPKDCP